MFIWDTTAGFWVVHSFGAGATASFRSSGQWGTPAERAYNIDCDADGASDDLLLWDDDTGQVRTLSCTAGKPWDRRYTNFSSTLDIAASGDFSGDGRRNELFVFDRDARAWQVYGFSNCAPILARAGTFPVAYDVAWG